jgi:NAD(P)-dependent dehydrogenase (short-subunit alcohol dehydrogenase family)
MLLSNKIAIITGGGSGIGRAAVGLFAAEGASVIVADIREDLAKDAVASVVDKGGKAVAVSADVSNPAGANHIVDVAVQSFGGIDIVYNNAGGPPPIDGDVTELTEDDWTASFRVNFFGTVYVTRAAIPRMNPEVGGRIINTASCAAVLGVAGRDGYVAAKGAVVALTRSMAAEFGKLGITVNAVAPGVTQSDRVIELLKKDARTQALVARHVVGLLEPDDVAHAALFLASDWARKITGHILPVDSGATTTLSTTVLSAE